MPGDSRADISVHGLWKWGTTALFEMQIFNLDAGSYLRQTSTKALTTTDKEKKTSTSSPVWSVEIILLLWSTLRMEFKERSP